MGATRRKLSREFKLEAVRQLEAGRDHARQVNNNLRHGIIKRRHIRAIKARRFEGTLCELICVPGVGEDCGLRGRTAGEAQVTWGLSAAHRLFSTDAQAGPTFGDEPDLAPVR